MGATSLFHLFMLPRSLAIAIAISSTIVVGGCKDGTGPPTPSSVAAIASTLTATAGLPLAAAPTFAVRDASGGILGGVAVTVTVTSGGGTLEGAPAATLSGSPTPIGTWTLGRTAGVNTVTVTVADLTPVAITVTGVAGPPASLAVVGGNGQSALAGNTVPSPVSVQLRDQFGNGVAGMAVTFQVTAGGGIIGPATTTTDASGTAGGAIWRLGRSAVEQTVTATSGAFSAIASATVASDFNVDLRFFGQTAPSEAAAAFSEAAARIRAGIVGDIGDIDIPALSAGAGIDVSGCGIAGVNVNEVVDDVVIYATVTAIDGAGKILASAGPCIVRRVTGTSCIPTAPPGGQCNSFAVVGVMRFDVDDIAGLIATGRLNDVILHEMMHVVGVGTNWSGRSLLQGRGSGNPRFTGALGISGCNDAGGSTPCTGGIPVENTGGPGTADAHWRESTFDSELMTGFVEPPGIQSPLSNMTLQSLADEGYVVNQGATDNYLVPTQSASRELRASVMAAEAQPWEILLRPVFEIGPSGTIRQIRYSQ